LIDIDDKAKSRFHVTALLLWVGVKLFLLLLLLDGTKTVVLYQNY
jgi:hypothetical protein